MHNDELTLLVTLLPILCCCLASRALGGAEQPMITVKGQEQPVPQVNFAPGPKYADANRRFGIASSIARAPGGRLWCGFTSGGKGEGGR